MTRMILAVLAAVVVSSTAHAQDAGVRGPDTRVYKTTPQGELSLHIFRPAADSAQPSTRRAMIILHGGGWTVGEPEWVFATATHFAQRGVVAIPVKYRLSNDKDVTPIEALHDVRDAILWLRRNAAELRIDPQHIAAYGTSAGGQLAAAAALIGPPNDSGAPTLLVLSSPAVAAATDNWFRKLIGTRANPASMSPDSLVRANAPAALVLQGEKDVVTPLRGAQGFCERMRAVNATCELVTYPGVGHLFARNLDHRSQEQGPRNSDPAVAASARTTAEHFLARHGYIRTPR
ncbi:MAG TPA: alpha/beta hydrolase [Gemmatimonadaceae bacterium]|nr:alpha/beta hydrolase [Gemmatimonadaceae bacterium]